MKANKIWEQAGFVRAAGWQVDLPYLSPGLGKLVKTGKYHPGQKAQGSSWEELVTIRVSPDYLSTS